MSRPKILVIEDAKNILTLITFNLEQAGFEVRGVKRGEEALERVRQDVPDLVILDLMLPGMDGLEVCKTLRREVRTSRVPLIMLTAKGEESDKILGLELGADDYLTKPFSPKELIARVRALLRRSQPKETPRVLRIGDLHLDPERHRVFLKDKPIHLTHKEFHLLKFLMASDGRTLSRDTLLNRVWGYDRSSEIDSRTVDMHVAQLRKKIKTEAKRILTVKNEGYQFNNE